MPIITSLRGYQAELVKFPPETLILVGGLSQTLFVLRLTPVQGIHLSCVIQSEALMAGLEGFNNSPSGSSPRGSWFTQVWGTGTVISHMKQTAGETGFPTKFCACFLAAAKYLHSVRFSACSFCCTGFFVTVVD